MCDSKCPNIAQVSAWGMRYSISIHTMEVQHLIETSSVHCTPHSVITYDNDNNNKVAFLCKVTTSEP